MLSIEVTLYAHERGGRQRPIIDMGYACLCKINPNDRTAYDCRLNFYCKYPVSPGEIRRADMFLITGEDAEPLIRNSGRFFLYEDRIIGEGRLYTGRRREDLAQAWTSQARLRRRSRITSLFPAEEFLETVQQRPLAG